MKQKKYFQNKKLLKKKNGTDLYWALDLFAAGNQKVSMDNWAFHPNRWKLHQPFLREERSAQYSNIKRMHLVHCTEPSAFFGSIFRCGGISSTSQVTHPTLFASAQIIEFTHIFTDFFLFAYFAYFAEFCIILHNFHRFERQRKVKWPVTSSCH